MESSFAEPERNTSHCKEIKAVDALPQKTSNGVKYSASFDSSTPYLKARKENTNDQRRNICR